MRKQEALRHEKLVLVERRHAQQALLAKLQRALVLVDRPLECRPEGVNGELAIHVSFLDKAEVLDVRRRLQNVETLALWALVLDLEVGIFALELELDGRGAFEELELTQPVLEMVHLPEYNTLIFSPLDGGYAQVSKLVLVHFQSHLTAALNFAFFVPGNFIDSRAQKVVLKGIANFKLTLEQVVSVEETSR